MFPLLLQYKNETSENIGIRVKLKYELSVMEMRCADKNCFPRGGSSSLKNYHSSSMLCDDVSDCLMGDDEASVTV